MIICRLITNKGGFSLNEEHRWGVHEEGANWTGERRPAIIRHNFNEGKIRRGPHSLGNPWQPLANTQLVYSMTKTNETLHVGKFQCPLCHFAFSQLSLHDNASIWKKLNSV